MQRNWLLGYRIAQEELKGEDRSEYGKGIIKNLADELTAVYGKGFDFGSLYKYCRFYKLYPEILDSVSPKSSMLLSWTHYRVLLQVEDKTARDWYTKEEMCIRDSFYKKLAGQDAPERKRKIIGEEFIRVFEDEAKKIGAVDFLAQEMCIRDRRSLHRRPQGAV